MKITLIIFTFVMFSTHAYPSEALRYAKHGCKKNKSKVACDIVKALSFKKKGRSLAQVNKPDDYQESKNTFETETGKMTVSIKMKADGSQMKELFSDCKSFGENVKNCTPFSCSYKHPMMKNEVMIKKIVGTEDGLCRTEEEMPNNGLMTCLFSQDRLETVAEFADTMGKKHTDKMSVWMNDGTCKISGY